MNKIIAAFVNALAPHLEKFLREKFDEWMPKLIDAVGAKFDAWMPKVIEAVVVAVAKTGAGIAKSATDQITDVIPGELDDQVVDGFVNSIFDQLGNLWNR